MATRHLRRNVPFWLTLTITIRCGACQWKRVTARIGPDEVVGGSMQVDVMLSAAALLVGIAAAYWTWRTVQPRAELTILMTETPLMHRAESAGSRVSVEHADFGTLTDPVVARLLITNSGRTDIGSDQFDRDLPLTLDVGAPIVELLGYSNSRPALAPPPLKVEGSKVELGPGLLGRRQTLTVAMLLDAQPDLRVNHALRNLRFRAGDEDEKVKEFTRVGKPLLVVITAALAPLAVFMYPPRVVVGAPPADIWIGLWLIWVGFLVMPLAWALGLLVDRAQRRSRLRRMGL